MQNNNVILQYTIHMYVWYMYMIVYRINFTNFAQGNKEFEIEK